MVGLTCWSANRRHSSAALPKRGTGNQARLEEIPAAFLFDKQTSL
jgi:hypothetical protein